jgi:hypothetical protein
MKAYHSLDFRLVTTSGYMGKIWKKGKLNFSQRRKNFATASVRVRTCNFS